MKYKQCALLAIKLTEKQLTNVVNISIREAETLIKLLKLCRH